MESEDKIAGLERKIAGMREEMAREPDWIKGARLAFAGQVKAVSLLASNDMAGKDVSEQVGTKGAQNEDAQMVPIALQKATPSKSLETLAHKRRASHSSSQLSPAPSKRTCTTDVALALSTESPHTDSQPELKERDSSTVNQDVLAGEIYIFISAEEVPLREEWKVEFARTTERYGGKEVRTDTRGYYIMFGGGNEDVERAKDCAYRLKDMELGGRMCKMLPELIVCGWSIDVSGRRGADLSVGLNYG